MSPQPVRSLLSAAVSISPTCEASPLRGSEDVLRGGGDGQQVPVIDRTVVQLLAEDAQQIDPNVLTGERGRLLHRNGDHPLDGLDCGPAGSSGALLLPGPLTTGVRAPLRDGPACPRGDRAAAPPARGGSCPSGAAARGSRRRLRDGGALLSSCHSPLLLPTLPLALPAPRPVVGASLAAHGHTVRS